MAVGGTSLDPTGPVETAWSGSGGGISIYNPNPAFQPSATFGSFRKIPDVSLLADPSLGVAVVQDGLVRQVGGTSLSAPCWAGMLAQINSARVKVGKTVYGPTYLFNNFVYSNALVSAIYAKDFRDIVSGSNGGYTAGVGYDNVTGWGTPAWRYFFSAAGSY